MGMSVARELGLAFVTDTFFARSTMSKSTKRISLEKTLGPGDIVMP